MTRLRQSLTMCRIPSSFSVFLLITLFASLPLFVYVVLRFVLPAVEPSIASAQIKATVVTLKPINDGNTYRGLDLNNGMKILIASDSTDEKACASLCVLVGHMSDPWELQGLAHFTEHMIFMGSQNYPNENHIFSFMNSHGGQSNAYTSMDTTCYYYDVDPDYLEESLAILSDVIKNPLFAEHTAAREIWALNTEHTRNMKTDSWRQSQVDKATADQHHPYSKFSTGTKHILEKGAKKLNTTVIEEVRKFFKSNYVGRMMNVFIKGRESSDELQRFVMKYFSSIPRGDHDAPTVNGHPYENSSARIIRIIPIIEQTTLEVNFPLPDVRPYYRSIPHFYITKSLLNYKSAGSLYAYLNNMTYVTSLSARINSVNRNFCSLTIEAQLTEKGFAEYDKVLDSIFSYLNFHRITGPRKHVFEDLRQLRELQFKYLESPQGQDSARMLSENLRIFEWQHTISATFIADDYRPDRIEALLSLLTPENCRIFLQSPNFANESNLLFEPLYNTSYSIEKISEERLSRWRTIPPRKEFAIPKRNEYLPDDFTLYSKKSPLRKYPILLREAPHSQLWMFDQHVLDIPRSIVTIVLRSDIIRQDSADAVKTALIAKAFRLSMADEWNAIEAAESDIEFGMDLTGFSLHLSGYSQKQLQTIRQVIRTFANFRLDPTRFELAKQSIRKFIKASMNRRFPQSLSDLRYRLLIKGSSAPWKQQLVYLEECTAENTQHLFNRLLKRLTAVVFVYGNVNEQIALQLFDAVTPITEGTPITLEDIPSTHEYDLPEGMTFRYIEAIEEQPLNSVQVHYSLGPIVENTRNVVIAELLTTIFTDLTSDVLRTKELLGYGVMSTLRRNGFSHSLVVSVESAFNISYVEQRILHYLQNTAPNHVRQLPKKIFENHKLSLIRRKLQNSTSMEVVTKKLWMEISRSCHFDRFQEEAEIAKGLSKDDVVRYMESNILDRKKATLLIIAIEATQANEKHGKIRGTTHDGKEMIYGDIRTFQSTLQLIKEESKERCKLYRSA